MFGMGPWELAVLLFIVPAYFMPSVIAYSRGHRSRRLLAFFNVFAGWTGVGWIGVLVWAFVDDGRRSEPSERSER